MSKSLDQLDGPVRKISPIIEISAASYHHLRLICNSERGVSLKEKLEGQTFDGTEVLWSSHPHVPKPGDVCEVSHFGHDISCEGSCYGGGVFRLFETQLLVPEDAEVISERWEIGDGIEISVTHEGRGVSSAGLEHLASETPEVGRFGRDYTPDEPTSEEERLDEQKEGMGIGAAQSHQGSLSSF